ncbi:hypothetical protein B14911_04969 [Bacillus sp. NRRL B-14911]|nr:hypothetical protein B14911_04969 [Bacillus sp. NRRL B-14911]
MEAASFLLFPLKKILSALTVNEKNVHLRNGRFFNQY